MISTALGSIHALGQDNHSQQLARLNTVVLQKINNGEPQSFESLTEKDYLVVVFLGTECPLAKVYIPRIASIAQRYKDIAKTVGVNANHQDTVEEIEEYIKQHAVSFAIFKYAQGQLATTLNAKRTPEAFILDRQGNILYQGRIDDQYGVGYARDSAQQEDLKTALDELRQGQAVSVPRTEAVGCFIGRIQSSSREGESTYHNKISAIIHKHCVECHQQGEIGPFSLMQYDDVAAWSETIGEVIQEGRMPPWHANPAHGSFANTRLMSVEEKAAVSRWIEDGCPRGTGPTRYPAPNAVSGWQFERAPDQIIPMREKPFTVPAEGTVEYQYFVVDPKFTKDRWVTAAEVMPGNRSVVHHAIIFISTPGQDTLDNYGWLAAYVPGQRFTPLKPGQARRIPAGSQLVFQMHYTPNGSVQKDQTKIGLIFSAPEEVDEEIITLIAANRHFKIPPGAAAHRVDSALTEFPQDAQLTALIPHMHLRGKSFQIIYQDKSKEKTVLLDVPKYDFNWQHIYRLKDPLPLNHAKQIDCVAHFDNSAKNIVNPDSTATVRWGDQSWEEMMVAFFEISVPRHKNTEKRKQRDGQQRLAAQRLTAQQFATNWLKKRDRNRDQRVQRNEVNDSFRRFAFSKIDRNHDQEISLEETAAYILDSLLEEKQQEDIRRRLDQLQ
jgi:hypothetical protein